MKARALFFGLLVTCLLGQDLSKLPDWARIEAAAALKETPPQEANAWVLFMRHEVAYTGAGEVRKRTLRLVKVLTERGLGEGKFRLFSLGSRAEKIRSLKGWNLRPDGEVVQLSRKDVEVVDTDTHGTITTFYATEAEISRVAIGSLLAFESEEVCQAPMGPVDWVYLAEIEPVRRWEMTFGKKEGWFTDLKEVEARIEPRHWEAWGIAQERLPGGAIAASGIAPLPKDEKAHPHLINVLPRVELRFLDPKLSTAPSCASWDSFASWIFEHYRPAMISSKTIPLAGQSPKDALRTIYNWMSKELVYKQVYLTPERGWLPETCPEVVRKRFGDCKDHATCFLGEASGVGFDPCPVLCRIIDGVIEADQPVFPYVFNHVIAAVRLKETLGLPAEVETSQGRFLLVDSTDRFCTFGFLPSDHRNRRVLICTPTGAVWATVPASATMEPGLSIDLEGQVEVNGSVKAQIRLRETGNAIHLRQLALEHSTQQLRQWVIQHGFRLPPTGTLTDLSMGDPLDLEHPFEVRFTLTHPTGSVLQGKYLELVDWGLPGIPSPIQKPGVVRKLAVEMRANDALSLRAKWTFPHPVQPLLPVVQTDSPFRALTWQVLVEGASVRIVLDERRKDVWFDSERKAEGVAAQKEDRIFLQNLHEQGLRFRTDW
ncbi:MAG: transglutaminase domain-containing protein [Holophagaceae bacterium]|nr:transglutaminase domain-containing protein [Holophagaceae bacterium]